VRVLANRWEIEALVGRGAMGEVFRARDLALGETVAVKVLRLDASTAAWSLDLFKQEVRLARRVTHKNVARVFDLVEDGDILLLTMELVEGETLADLLARQTLPLDRAAGIALEIASGLIAVHAAGVVHRDLKPSNVLLEDGGRVVLADFGVARSMIDGVSGRAMIVGTPRYMAPEQARGAFVDARADVYSFGVMLDEMTADADARWAELADACRQEEAANRPTAAEVHATLAELADRPSQLPPTVRTPRRPVETTKASRSIVVMPFDVQGEPSSAGEAIARELTDVLCTIRELRVVASRFATSAEVDAVVDGTVHIEGDRVRITARLVERASGAQLWREQFEGSLSSLFSFESAIAKRIAEHLRLRLTVMAFDEGVPAEAVRCYLDASAIKEGIERTEHALRLLERAVEIHPTFAPALSALAVRSITAWYIPFIPTPPDWAETCAERVRRADKDAPSIPETHVASGMLHLERGAVRAAEVALRRALQLAPTSVDALTVLGELECWAGRPSGLEHARRAMDLDPGAVIAAVTLAREDAFRGDVDRCIARLDALEDESWSPPPFLMRVRAAAWHGKSDIIRAWLSKAAGMSDASGNFPYGEVLARTFLGESPYEDAAAMVSGMLAIGKSPRFVAEVRRVAAEIAALVGRHDDAIAHVAALGDMDAFFDVDWLARCPALAPLRADAAYAIALSKAQARANT
jgi:serine/threonine-protein kinase